MTVEYKKKKKQKPRKLHIIYFEIPNLLGLKTEDTSLPFLCLNINKNVATGFQTNLEVTACNATAETTCIFLFGCHLCARHGGKSFSMSSHLFFKTTLQIRYYDPHCKELRFNKLTIVYTPMELNSQSIRL